jgi:hypothetical protein
MQCLDQLQLLDLDHDLSPDELALLGPSMMIFLSLPVCQFQLNNFIIAWQRSTLLIVTVSFTTVSEQGSITSAT